jgi:hypothetical protein
LTQGDAARQETPSLTEKHDKAIVRKLNPAMRAGTYTEQLFTERTGKSVKELDEEWRASLKQ